MWLLNPPFTSYVWSLLVISFAQGLSLCVSKMELNLINVCKKAGIEKGRLPVVSFLPLDPSPLLSSLKQVC